MIDGFGDADLRVVVILVRPVGRSHADRAHGRRDSRWSAPGTMGPVDLSDTGTAIAVISGVLIVIGLFGIVIPVIPGIILCWLGVLLWALLGDGGWFKWLVLAGVTVIAAVGTVVKYVWSTRSLKRTGVPSRSIIVGGVLGIIGFFAIPVVGLPLGFVFGIWLSEQIRLRDGRRAWRATVQAVKAVGLALLVELTSGLLITVIWVVGLFVA
jgi:uncharacterized protein